MNITIELPEDSRKLAIVGSRSFKDYKLLCQVVKSEIDFDKIGLVISGGANGADSLADKFASDNELAFLRLPAQWKKRGKGAGMARNEHIIRAADVVIAFWDGQSSGTKNSIEWAKKLKKELVEAIFKPEKEAKKLKKDDFF